MEKQIPPEIAEAHPDVQLRFFECIEAGSSERLSIMLALQSPPAINTETRQVAGRPMLGDQMSKQKLNQILASARAQGYNPSSSDLYNPTLARFPGDKQAFIPATGGNAHVRKVCEKNNWSCQGRNERKARPEQPTKDIPLADDIGRRLGRQILRENPDMTPSEIKSLKEVVLKKHGPQET